MCGRGQYIYLESYCSTATKDFNFPLAVRGVFFCFDGSASQKRRDRTLIINNGKMHQIIAAMCHIKCCALQHWLGLLQFHNRAPVPRDCLTKSWLSTKTLKGCCGPILFTLTLICIKYSERKARGDYIASGTFCKVTEQTAVAAPYFINAKKMCALHCGEVTVY